MQINEETFFYKEATEQLAETIEFLLLEGEKEGEGYFKWIYPVAILNDEEYFDWSFSVNKVEGLKKGDYVISGLAGANESDIPSIHITITLPKGSWIKKHNVCMATLRGVIAHEIHHLAQNTDDSGHTEICHPLLEKIEERVGNAAYLLSQSEIEAFKIGARAESFYSGQSQKEIMLEYIEGFGLERKDALSITNAWLNTKFKVIETNIRRSNANT